MGKLTDKQIIFANEYLLDFNATKAYKKAYPNVKKDSGEIELGEVKHMDISLI